MRSWLAIAIALSPAACLRTTSFKCSASDQCGANGTCELPIGYCSFPDPTCGHRFGDSAGELANQCVSGSPIDAGPTGDVPAHADAAIDSPGIPCPPDYAQAGGYPGHRYKILAALSWDVARPACASANTFLAIPTEAAAVTALDSLVGTGSYWIGISEQGGTYPTVLGPVATYLPWAPNGQSTNGNSHCVEVAATGATMGTFDLQRCTDTHPAVCECDP